MDKSNEFVEKLRKNHSLVTTRNMFFDASKQMDYNIFLVFSNGQGDKSLSQYTEKELFSIHDRYGNNLLHMAELLGCGEIALYLCIKAPKLIEQQNSFGQYPVHFASLHPRHLEKYPSYLLQKKDDTGIGLLHVASARGVLANIIYLLPRQPIINEAHQLGSLPMHCAMNNYDPDPKKKQDKIIISQKLIKYLGPTLAKKQLEQKGLFEMTPMDWAEETLQGFEIDNLFQN